MNKFGLGLLIGGLLTAALAALMYLANQLVGLPYAPFEFFNWITRVLPGGLITFGIDFMIDAILLLGLDVADIAKTAERVSANLQFVALGALVVATFFTIIDRRRLAPTSANGLLLGALFGLPLIAISLAITQSSLAPAVNLLWLLLLYLLWGRVAAGAYGRLYGAATPTTNDDMAVTQIGRRQFLLRFGAATATLSIVGSGVGLALAAAERRRRSAALDDTMAHNSEGSAVAAFPNADDPIVPVAGTRPEYTPVKDHYQVFLQTEPTVIKEAAWTLPIVGLVDNPLLLTLDDIRNNYPARDQYVTLNCISGRVGTTLISTTLWTGVSAQELLADAGIQEGARFLHIKSGDGFYETVDLALINADPRIMFCYAWDGNTLPVDHGFPLRIWIPDRYGMKQPKWITEIMVTDSNIPGYWVERNWDELAQVRTTSVVDTVALIRAADDAVETMAIGGIAFAGDRQISRVETRVNGGPWQPAQLRAPLSETTWVIWRAEWPFAAGDQQFEVRCFEGDGAPQIEEKRDNRPSGATGIHSYEVTL